MILRIFLVKGMAREQMAAVAAKSAAAMYAMMGDKERADWARERYHVDVEEAEAKGMAEAKHSDRCLVISEEGVGEVAVVQRAARGAAHVSAPPAGPPTSEDGEAGPTPLEEGRVNRGNVNQPASTQKPHLDKAPGSQREAPAQVPPAGRWNVQWEMTDGEIPVESDVLFWISGQDAEVIRFTALIEAASDSEAVLAVKERFPGARGLKVAEDPTGMQAPSRHNVVRKAPNRPGTQ